MDQTKELVKTIVEGLQEKRGQLRARGRIGAFHLPNVRESVRRRDYGGIRGRCRDLFQGEDPQNIQKPMTRNKKASPLLSNNEAFLLFYQDSNLDKQDQNLLCYHYTIEQYPQNRRVNLKRCSTWIRTRTNRTRICCATITP